MSLFLEQGYYSKMVMFAFSYWNNEICYLWCERMLHQWNIKCVYE